MNNAYISQLLQLDEIQDENKSEFLQNEEQKIIKIIEHLGNVRQSKDWIELNKLFFSEIQNSLERQLKLVALKKPIDESTIYVLQGEIKWARRYSNLEELIKFFRNQLEAIRKINGK